MHHRRNLAALIGAARPGFSESHCFGAATQIVGMLEELAIFTGAGMKYGVERATLMGLVRQAWKSCSSVNLRRAHGFA